MNIDYSNIVILNYDLGIRGDYDKLYVFLDTYEASDCGNSNCVFQYKFNGKDLTHNEKFEQLSTKLSETITFSRTDRIYVIVHDEHGKPKGKFLFGQRKTPIWDGYAVKEDDSDLPF